MAWPPPDGSCWCRRRRVRTTGTGRDSFLARRLTYVEGVRHVVDRNDGSLGLSADQVLTTTRAVRKRLDLARPIPRSLIEECVEIAVQAPSGRNRQQWDFVFVEERKQRSAVADIWRQGLASGLGIPSGPGPTRLDFRSPEWGRIADSLRYLTEHLHQVPILLIPCLRVGSRDELTSVRAQAGQWGSVMPAFWSFMLAARDRGLGTAWTTSHLSYEREMADLLALPYDTVVQAALTPVAFTVGTDFRPGPRAEADHFIHWDRW